MLFLTFLSVQTYVSGKYIFNYEIEVADLNIDRTKPILEIISISNTNASYKNYANKTHTITLRIKFIEKNIGNDQLEKDEILICVGANPQKNYNISIEEIEKKSDSITYDIKLSNLTSNGKLTIYIEEGAITDTAGWKSENKIIDTNIEIDNIAPEGEFSTEKIANGKIKGIIQANEGIRKIEGWELLENNKTITKEFTNNLFYKIKITDYAENSSEVEVNIVEATNIILSCAAHNSEVGWSYGYSNYDIVGKEAIKRNPIYKVEALAFSFQGNIDKDFIKVRAYDYNYWGEGSYARCSLTNKKYKYGYNPSETSWETMNSEDLVTLKQKQYIELGGGGANQVNKRDVNGENPISQDTEGKYYYGISGINMKLKDESYYSIIYQILIDGVGWIKPTSDGKECAYRHDKTFSAFRMALIPKTEKEYLMDMWNKDVGTFNM